MLIENKVCQICDASEWHSLDYLRNQKYWYENNCREEDEPVGMKICKSCGFATYDFVDEKRLEEHYNWERPVMKNGNIITTNRKNLYHDLFLEEILTKKEWNILNWNILDVGMAQGGFLNHLRQKYNLYGLYGTEWSEAFLSYAKNEYGIIGTKEINKDIKYDFVICYHVLEHIQNFIEKLIEIKNVMTDEGYLYLSVPTWMECLDNSDGSFTRDIEHYYHLNHINVFTEVSFENTIKKVGFKIIKRNKETYGDTVLLQKDNPGEIIKEDYKIFVDRIERQKKAIDIFNANTKDVDKALEIYPDYPDLYLYKSQQPETVKSYDAQNDILNDGLKKCTKNHKIVYQIAILNFQWDENTPKNHFYSNNIKKAERLFIELLDGRPNENIYFILGRIEERYKKNFKTAIDWYRKVLEIDPRRWGEINDYISVVYKEMINENH